MKQNACLKYDKSFFYETQSNMKECKTLSSFFMKSRMHEFPINPKKHCRYFCRKLSMVARVSDVMYRVSEKKYRVEPLL